MSDLHEALELRKNGIGSTIVILCGIRTQEDVQAVVDKDLTPVLFDMDAVELLASEAARKGKRANIHLKVDTGMGRLGIPHSEAGPLMKRIKGIKGIYLEALTSHLSSADEPDSEFTMGQIGNFKAAIDIGRTMGLDLPMNNLANSAGTMAYKDSHFNMVRPGIMLYGGLPSPGFQAPSPLKPVMDFRGRVLQIRDLPDHTPVSYGRAYYTNGPKRTAVISMGYGDGLPRSLSNKGKLLIKGKRADIIGRVCMNMIICDITNIKNVLPGDEAVLLGHQGDMSITADEIAMWAETISYEIFCSIGQKATKEFVE
ncbi:MAG: alanine racemase [Deltaproteobacteria bacterium]|nr:alanine racemase [Deltaproteobacteria bacterium]